MMSGFPSKDPQIFCDLNKFRNGKTSTVPLVCTITNLIPDLCVFWENDRKLVIIEHTVLFELNAEKVHTRKSDKYAPIINDNTKQ